jgi:hypothetical protein
VNDLSHGDIASQRFREHEGVEGQQQTVVLSELIGEDETDRDELRGFPPACGWHALNCAPGTFPANPTATQNIYELWNCYPHNETFSLFQMDLPSSITGLSPALPNSKYGPYTFFHDQFSSLYTWRNISTSDYNALQVTYNVRWGANLQGQFNYTFSKSFDEASAAERVGPYEGTGGTGNDLNGGGIVINSWDPLALQGSPISTPFTKSTRTWSIVFPSAKARCWRETRAHCWTP